MGKRTMDIILFVSVIVYLIVTAYAGYAAIEKLKGDELSEEKRIQRYRFSFLWNVASGGVVMLLIVMGPATLEETVFRPISFLQGSHRYLAYGTWILCGLLGTVFIFQIAVFLINPTYRDSVSKQIEEKTHSGKVYDRVVNGLIPRTRREGSLYLCMAVHFLFDISAAFLCEEDKYEV